MRGWYVVSCRSEWEKKIGALIKKAIENLGLQNKIFQVIVPNEEVIEIKQNKKHVKERPYFTGYLFVEMEMDQDTYWVIRNIPGVSGFLGGVKPTPMSEEEIINLQELISKPPETRPKLAVSFEKEESVRIIDGPFKHFMGAVESVDEERGKLKIMVTIFGRPTPIELDFFRGEKM